MTAIFIPSPPSASCPRRSFCARKKSTITGTITSSVAAIVRFHCTWCSERNCERPIDSTQWCGVLAGVEQRQEEVVEACTGTRRARPPRSPAWRAGPRPCQDPQLAAAVHARRVQVLLGDRQEELPQQEDRERVAEPVRQDHRPERPDEVSRRVELRPHHVERHDRDLRRQHQRHQHDHERAVRPRQRSRAARRRRGRSRRRRRASRAPSTGACSRPAPERCRRRTRRRSCAGGTGAARDRARAPVGRHQRGQRDEHERRQERDRQARSARRGSRRRAGSAGGDGRRGATPGERRRRCRDRHRAAPP